MNTSGINPTGHMILVRMEAVEEKTAGGILLPSKHLDRENLGSTTGTLVAAGPCAGDYADWPEGHEFPPVGSRVVTRKFPGQEIKGNDGAEYRLCEDKDVLAVMEG